jgi:hypothetical protein
VLPLATLKKGIIEQDRKNKDKDRESNKEINKEKNKLNEKDKLLLKSKIIQSKITKTKAKK